jgi:hypothetical protein
MFASFSVFCRFCMLKQLYVCCRAKMFRSVGVACGHQWYRSRSLELCMGWSLKGTDRPGSLKSCSGIVHQWYRSGSLKPCTGMVHALEKNEEVQPEDEKAQKDPSKFKNIKPYRIAL